MKHEQTELAVASEGSGGDKSSVMFQQQIKSLQSLLASCDAFRLGSSQQRVIPLSAPVARLLQDEGQARASRFVQELVRAKRHSVHELVRAQPHLVHDMGWPEIHETSRSQGKTESVNSSQLNAPARTSAAANDNLDVEDEMERMVHLAVPQDAGGFGGQSDAADPETELLGGPGAADASQEASGFYGTDLEDRDRGEERERRGGEEEEEEEEKDEDDVLEASEGNHTTPDLDSLIGYSPSFHPSSSQEPSVSFPAEGHDPGLQEHRASPVLEVGPLERELWEAEGEEDVQSSGYGVPRPSITTARTTSAATATSTAAADGDAAGTATPETDTGTDFGLLGSYTKDVTEDEEAERKEVEEEEEEEAGLTHLDAFTQNPTAPEVGLAPSREPLQPSVEEEEEHGESKVLKGKLPPQMKDGSEEVDEEEMAATEKTKLVPLTTDASLSVGVTYDDLSGMEKNQQVVCIDWSELTGRGYVVLNMTQNMNCEEFRVCQGVQLLKVLERVFARRLNSPEGSWVIYLSKPTHQQHQLLMNVASERGVIATKDVLRMLGEIRKSLEKMGIESYSAASTCQSRPSQTRSDYGKLFVVLVIIGSVCMVIITSGFIYICWQRRLPATKTTFRAEELHFVENGCHDNPTLDVTNDGHPEMREKKPSTNGLAGGGEGGGEEGSRWQVFVNQAATEEEEEEQDTHL
ncbi:podocalyxin-like protein 2 [Stegastes partitus]|uniref:Podocalyxin-like protein 2 n=1 Tax=Stegastes partitus TaxID=144197 RepID=A0A9Y4ND16_9TELE|nr:PREDICTED: podocalyxin-like protein 2 [Stegastes partitus]